MHWATDAFRKRGFDLFTAARAGAFFGAMLGDFHRDLLRKVEHLSLFMAFGFYSAKACFAMRATSTNPSQAMGNDSVRIGHLFERFPKMTLLAARFASALGLALLLLRLVRIIPIRRWRFATGAGFGIRIPIAARNETFDKSWKDVELSIDGKTCCVAITGGFWRDCPELRSKEIGLWLIRKKLSSRPKRKPHAVSMKHLEGNRFEVSKYPR